MSTLRRATACCAVAAALLTAGCTSSEKKSDFRSVPAPTVGLTIGKAGTTVKIGVVYTPEDGFPGTQDAGLAEGAVVAAQRINSGRGEKVQIVAKSDVGSPAGARAAVAALLTAGVAGIVYASEGDQLAAGLEAATKAGVATLLPYDLAATASGGGIFRTGPTPSQVLSTMASSLRARGLRSPVMVTTGAAPSDVSTLGLQQPPTRVTAGTGLSRQVADAVTGIGTSGAGSPDSVIVWADAADSALIVAALQQANVSAPVFLAPSALSGTFATQLLAQADNDGLASTAGDFTTVGEAVSDFSTSTTSQAFLAALRATAANDKVTALDGTKAFADDAARGGEADTRSHDAVIALAVAAAKATSPNAAAVASALAGLSLGGANGLAGAPLNFAADQVVATGSVVALKASPQTSGARNAFAQSPGLSWFPTGS